MGKSTKTDLRFRSSLGHLPLTHGVDVRRFHAAHKITPDSIFARLRRRLGVAKPGLSLITLGAS